MRHFCFAGAPVAALSLLCSAALASSTSVRFNYGPELYETNQLGCSYAATSATDQVAHGKSLAEIRAYTVLANAYKSATGQNLPKATDQCPHPPLPVSRKATFAYKTFFNKLASQACRYAKRADLQYEAAVKEDGVIWRRIAGEVKDAGGKPPSFKSSKAHC